MTRMIILALLLQLALSTNDAALTESKDNMDTVQMNMNGAGRDDHDHDHAEAHSENHSAMSAIHSKPTTQRRRQHLQQNRQIYWDAVALPEKPAQQRALWATKAVSRSCPTSCGSSDSTLYGRVYCKRKGKKVSVSKCQNLPKPAAPSQSCHATHECVSWATRPVSGSCTTTCGYNGGTLSGSVYCKGDSTGDEIPQDGSAKLCPSHGKPSAPTTACPKTDECCSWATTAVSDSCPTSCGTSRTILYGTVDCKQNNGYSGSCITVLNGGSKKRNCVGPEPTKPKLTCAKTADCYHWVQTEPGSCRTGCRNGVNQQAYRSEGPIGCNKLSDGVAINPFKTFSQHNHCDINKPKLTKPSVKYIDCPSILQCVRWVEEPVQEGCNKECGQPVHYRYGRVICKTGETKIADSECISQGKAKPSVPQLKCSATSRTGSSQCCWPAQTCCWDLDGAKSCNNCCHGYEYISPWTCIGSHRCKR